MHGDCSVTSAMPSPRLLVAMLVLATLTAHGVVVLAGSNEAGRSFLAQNLANNPGVVALPSGLQYKVVVSGKGGFHPTVDSPCECHYEGKLVDGTIFDSSYARSAPSTFAPSQVRERPTTSEKKECRR